MNEMNKQATTMTAMWKSLRLALRETEGFFFRIADSEASAQEALLFFPHGIMALLVLIPPGGKPKPEQIRRAERFRDYAVPVYYAGSPNGVYCAATDAARNIDLGAWNCYS